MCNPRRWRGSLTSPKRLNLRQKRFSLDRDFIAAGQDFVRSDTGELARNWTRGAQAINTDRSQAAHGWVGDGPIRLRHVTFDIKTPKAAVAVSSLDGQPINKSRRVLITAIARVVASSGGKMPLLSEPVRGELVVQGLPGMKLIPLDGHGKHREAVPAEYRDGKYHIRLPAGRGTHWFLLVGPSG